MCKFYRKSLKRMRQLQNMSEALECEPLKPQHLHTARWVASKVCDLNALVGDWKLEMYCSTPENIGDKKGEEATAAGALLKITEVFHTCNYRSLCGEFLGSLHRTLPYLSGKGSSSQSGGLPC
jgi:hypothetical protein